MIPTPNIITGPITELVSASFATERRMLALLDLNHLLGEASKELRHRIVEIEGLESLVQNRISEFSRFVTSISRPIRDFFGSAATDDSQENLYFFFEDSIRETKLRSPYSVLEAAADSNQLIGVVHGLLLESSTSYLEQKYLRFAKELISKQRESSTPPKSDFVSGNAKLDQYVTIELGADHIIEQARELMESQIYDVAGKFLTMLRANIPLLQEIIFDRKDKQYLTEVIELSIQPLATNLRHTDASALISALFSVSEINFVGKCNQIFQTLISQFAKSVDPSEALSRQSVFGSKPKREAEHTGVPRFYVEQGSEGSLFTLADFGPFESRYPVLIERGDYIQIFRSDVAFWGSPVWEGFVDPDYGTGWRILNPASLYGKVIAGETPTLWSQAGLDRDSWASFFKSEPGYSAKLWKISS